MRRGLSTLSLAVALTACSKPNPLFLDTWEGASESASQATTASSSGVPTSTTVTDTGAPTTTTTGSETGTSGPTSETTSLDTTDPATGTNTTDPMCVSQALDPIAPAKDTFIVNVETVGPVCTLSGQNEEFPDLPCDKIEFGKQPILSLFNFDPMSGLQYSVYIVDFERDAEGRLIYGGEPLEPDAIETVALRIAYSNTFNAEWEKATVNLYAIPAVIPDMPAEKRPEWHEGTGAAKFCKDGANVLCAVCGPMGVPCQTPWWEMERLDISNDTLIYINYKELLPPGPMGSTEVIEFGESAKEYFGIKDIVGFAVVLEVLQIGGMPADAEPGKVRLHAREFQNAGLRPALLVDACLP